MPIFESMSELEEYKKKLEQDRLQIQEQMEAKAKLEVEWGHPYPSEEEIKYVDRVMERIREGHRLAKLARKIKKVY